MQKKNYVNFSGTHYTCFILILIGLLTYGCQDSTSTIFSATVDEPMISANTNSAPNKYLVQGEGKGLTLDVLEATGTEFKVFDAMGFKGEPDMSEFGIRPIEVIYSSHLFSTKRNKDNRWEYVSESQAAKLARKSARLKSRPVMVSPTHWTTGKDIETLKKSRHRLLRLYYDLKQAEPLKEYGYFSNMPIKVWWGKPPSEKHVLDWQARNDHLKGLANRVDILYLNGYTKSQNRERWVSNTIQMIHEAKRLSDEKPIYVVLWPQYSPNTPNNLEGTNIDRDFWRLQLETVKKYAHGIVLYAPYGKRWDETAPWWSETKKFMEDLGDYTAQPKVSDAKFKVFDGTRFRKKPGMTQYGFTPIKLIFHLHLWDKPLNQVGKWELPSKKLVKEYAKEAKEVNSDIAMINIERWPTKGSESVVSKSVDQLNVVYDWFKEAEPDMNFGYYSMVPGKFHWRSYPRPHWMRSMIEDSKRLTPLANKVDAYFISAYTKRNDREGWLINTKYHIKQAHAYSGNKPVYLTLWPQYYAPDKPGLDDQYIDKDFWRLQLETARKYADGVLIYFPYSVRWSEASGKPWWGETKQFLREMGKEK